MELREGAGPLSTPEQNVVGKRALILGIGGQDGYFMSWCLTRNKYHVTGLLLPSDLSSDTVPHLPQVGLRLVQGSISDVQLITKIVREEQPDEIYNFAGISFVPFSWETPAAVAQVNGLAVGHLLNIIRIESPRSRLFQAGSSEMFGHDPVSSPQNEDTPFNPDNPYGSSKVFAAHLIRNFRSRFGIFACTGIMYNHESEWRGSRFVTRKISMGAAAAKLGIRQPLTIGNLNCLRDWNFAGDFIDGMWRMVQAKEPRDYILASGRLHSVRDVANVAFGHVGLAWEDYVEVDPSLNRPAETVPLCGDPSRIKSELGWTPKVSFEDLVRRMVDKDIERLQSKPLLPAVVSAETLC